MEEIGEFNATEDVDLIFEVAVPAIKVSIVINILISCFVFASLSLASFPIYVIIFRANREQEKKTAVYPILNHFYHTTWITFCLLFVFFLIFISQFLTENQWIVDVLFHWQFILTNVFSSVNHMFLSILSVQRFVIYFWPDIGNYLGLKQKKIISRSLFLLYIWFFVQNIYFAYMTNSFLTLTESFGNTLINMKIKVIMSAELVCTPSLIQFSYLICNRRNLDDLRKRIFSRRIFQKFSRTSSSSNHVHPARIDTNTTTI
ncbi:hypothetical protein CAEBREN_22110 [Caenorhabditis brenneri]|uniref:Serpentine receptor class gamma n=1 Tax=Caenorhabditis brenneri TaxID=135651 RepID=G0NTM1_CAEBE|nr:hypothetical protein CAEBREN_22110 [Caenorhabditis brenneri]